MTSCNMLRKVHDFPSNKWHNQNILKPRWWGFQCFSRVRNVLKMEIVDVSLHPFRSFPSKWVSLKRVFGLRCSSGPEAAHLQVLYLMTDFVSSDSAYLQITPGKRRRTAVWISPLVMLEQVRCPASSKGCWRCHSPNNLASFTIYFPRVLRQVPKGLSLSREPMKRHGFISEGYAWADCWRGSNTEPYFSISEPPWLEQELSDMSKS